MGLNPALTLSQLLLINSKIGMTIPRILLEWGGMPSSLFSINDGFLSTPPSQEDA